MGGWDGGVPVELINFRWRAPGRKLRHDIFGCAGMVLLVVQQIFAACEDFLASLVGTLVGSLAQVSFSAVPCKSA
jgi:hypothetical protein